MPDYIIDAQIPELIRRLYNATSAGKLQWEMGADEYWFVCSVGRFGYSLNSRDRDNFAPFILRIYDERNGVEGAEMLQEIETDIDQSYTQDLFDLYWLAKRRTLNIDEIATEIFADFEDLE